MKICIAYMGLCLTIAMCAVAGTHLGDLTGPWKLLVDDHFIAHKVNVSRVYHAFEKHEANPLLRADTPWEGTTSYLYGTVLPSEKGSGYRMWYHSWAMREYRMLYATSRDGLQWEKPALGLVDFKGSTQNNILFRHTHENHSPQVIHTPWDKDPARRYKFIYYEYGRTPPHFTTSGYYGMTSPDGVHWNVAKDMKPLFGDYGDVGNFVWDALGNRYMGWPKKFDDVRGFRRRCVGFTTTTDFENWPASTLVLTPDTFDDRWVTKDAHKDAHTDFYGMSGFAYESMYIGFLWVFPITDGKNDGPIFVELVTSHDGEHWARQEKPRTPILPLGADGAGDDGMVFTPNHPLVEDGAIKLYYGGFDVTHSAGDGNAAIGLATLRKDGFASLDAGSKEGTILCKPLLVAGESLAINYRSNQGWLKVEIVDEQGEVVVGYSRDDCTPLTGDSLDETVSWGTRNRLPQTGKPIQICLILRDAAVYSFRVGDNTTGSSPHAHH